MTNYLGQHVLTIGAGIVLACVAITIHLLRQIRRNPISRIPGPWITNWTDIIIKYKGLTGQRPIYVHSLHEKYGPIVRLAPGEIDITDIHAVKEIHSIKTGYLKSSWYQRFVPGVINVFNTSDVEFHRRHRRLLAGPLSESSLRTVEPFVRERAELAIRRIGEEMASRGATDIFKWSLFFSTDVIGELTFGESFRMLDIGKKNQYIEDLENTAKMGGLRATFPWLFKISMQVAPLPIMKRATGAYKRTRKYAEQSLQRYKRLLAADPTNSRPTLFTKLFKAGEEGLPDNEIQNEAMVYIVAGSDTTANTLTYLFWSVCRDERVKKALVEELASLPDDFDDQHLKGLSYLTQVIDETLRLFPAAPSGLPRVVPHGGAELADYFVPGGATVSTQAYSLHRDPDVFPSPTKFDPSRWAAPTKEMKDLFMPFGGGSRVCLGLHLARMELRLATALFFRSWPHARVSHLEGMSDADMEPIIYFLLSPKGKRCLIETS